MAEVDLSAIFAAPLNRTGMPYMVVGSVAAISYPLEKWAFARRRAVAVEEEQVWIAPPELVIIRKLEFYREGKQAKHIGDVQELLKFENLDLPFVESQVELLGLREEWLVCRPGAA